MTSPSLPDGYLFRLIQDGAKLKREGRDVSGFLGRSPVSVCSQLDKSHPSYFHIFISGAKRRDICSFGDLTCLSSMETQSKRFC